MSEHPPEDDAAKQNSDFFQGRILALEMTVSRMLFRMALASGDAEQFMHGFANDVMRDFASLHDGTGDTQATAAIFDYTRVALGNLLPSGIIAKPPRAN